MKLQAHHLTMLLMFKRWAPPAVQHNMAAPDTGTLGDLMDCDLLARNAEWLVVLTPSGEAAVQAAIDGMQAAVSHVT